MAANRAVIARLIGAHVAMVNAVGDDGYGEQIIANFRSWRACRATAGLPCERDQVPALTAILVGSGGSF